MCKCFYSQFGLQFPFCIGLVHIFLINASTTESHTVLVNHFFLLLHFIIPIWLFQQDNLAFPLICPDWNADEEMLLLEVFFMFYFLYKALFW